MEIKPGDIVEYQGRHVRVMDMTNTPSGFREQLLLSHFESDMIISVNDVKLIRVRPTLDSDSLILVGLVIKQPTDLNWLNLSLTQP